MPTLRFRFEKITVVSVATQGRAKLRSLLTKKSRSPRDTLRLCRQSAKVLQQGRQSRSTPKTVLSCVLEAGSRVSSDRVGNGLKDADRIGRCASSRLWSVGLRNTSKYVIDITYSAYPFKINLRTTISLDMSRKQGVGGRLVFPSACSPRAAAGPCPPPPSTRPSASRCWTHHHLRSRRCYF